jgi:hypothetical protein
MLGGKEAEIMKVLISVFTLLVIVSACGNKLPEPENGSKKIGFLAHPQASAASIQAQNDESFDVKYFVKENSLYLDCFVKDFTFSPLPNKEQASIRLYVDGRKLNDYDTAAFVVKSIPTGRHEIKLEIFHKNGKPAGLAKSFNVNIHSAI